MLLLLDIGNTHTHLGLGNSRRVFRQGEFPTAAWRSALARRHLLDFIGTQPMSGVALCSVVPAATVLARAAVRRLWRVPCFELTWRNLSGVGLDYPRPETIGPDRLANAIAARARYGAPCVVVDFGTAVTFDVVNRKGCYAGGIIAPGLAAMTEYLHEKTALLPTIHIREINKAVGKSTEEAMLIGAVHGYRGLIRELLKELRKELRTPRLPVVATGGYAQLMASKLPEIAAADPLLTLEGLRLAWRVWDGSAISPRPFGLKARR